MVTYTPDLEDVEDSSRLSRILRPRGWEHLSGPFQWYESPEKSFFEHEKHGLSIGIRTIGRFGQIANHLNENGEFPHPVYLLSGPPGIGKTATERLFARTHLSTAEELKPVTYQVDGGEEKATLVHYQTGEAFYINPSGPEDLCGPKAVKNSFEDPGNENNRRIRFYNASDLVKDDVREIAEWLKQDLFLEKKRVLVLSEIDQFTSAQAKLLKNELEPQNVNEGVLVMADTNHIGLMKKRFNKPGMQRFEHISLPRWKTNTLRKQVQNYLNLFSVRFEDQAFSDLNIEPAARIAGECEGSFRVMITFLQRILDHDGVVTPSVLGEIVKTDQEISNDKGEDSAKTKPFKDYKRTILNGSSRELDSFLRQLFDEQSIEQFLGVLTYHMIDTGSGTSLPIVDISPEIREIHDIVHNETGNPRYQVILSAPHIKSMTEKLTENR